MTTTGTTARPACSTPRGGSAATGSGFQILNFMPDGLGLSAGTGNPNPIAGLILHSLPTETACNTL